MKQYHPKTKIMASGIRTKEGEISLGCVSVERSREICGLMTSSVVVFVRRHGPVWHRLHGLLIKGHIGACRRAHDSGVQRWPAANSDDGRGHEAVCKVCQRERSCKGEIRTDSLRSCLLFCGCCRASLFTQMTEIDEKTFNSDIGLAGSDLLKQALKQQVGPAWMQVFTILSFLAAYNFAG